MNYPIARTIEEREALERALEEFRKDWGFTSSFGLRQLLQRWRDFVESVEDGYRLSYFDYTQDLSLRDEIERVKAHVPERLRIEIIDCIQPIDHRLKFATKQSRTVLGDAVYGPDRYWWWRIPKRLEGQLMEDLLRERIVEPRG